MSSWHRAAGGAAAGALTGALVLSVAVAVFVLFLRDDASTSARPPLPPGPSGRAGAPARVVVPSIDLRASVVPIEVQPTGVLDPPADVQEVGWWQRSAERRCPLRADGAHRSHGAHRRRLHGRPRPGLPG